MWVALEDVAIDANRPYAFMEGKLDMCLLGCLAMVGHSITTSTSCPRCNPVWAEALISEVLPAAVWHCKLSSSQRQNTGTDQARNKQPKGDSTFGLLTFVARPDCL